MSDKYRVPANFRIVSGGQTGADQGGLDWAIARGVPYGGWCPKGRRTEAGSIDPKYQLTETPQANYLERTEWNVRDSDATLIFTLTDKLEGGSKATADFAAKHGKPSAHVRPTIAPAVVARFLERNHVAVLNIAGTRGSKAPGLERRVAEMLDTALDLSALAAQ